MAHDSFTKPHTGGFCLPRTSLPVALRVLIRTAFILYTCNPSPCSLTAPNLSRISPQSPLRTLLRRFVALRNSRVSFFRLRRYWVVGVSYVSRTRRLRT